MRRQAAKVMRGPKRSQAGPATRRTRRLGKLAEGRVDKRTDTHVAVNAIILELAISFWLRCRSFLIATGRSGGNAYHERNAITIQPLELQIEG